jgi:hypothetical protein
VMTAIMIIFMKMLIKLKTFWKTQHSRKDNIKTDLEERG